MDKYQPLRDTIGLMAGTPVRRPASRDERFQTREIRRAEARTRPTLHTLVVGLLIRIPLFS